MTEQIKSILTTYHSGDWQLQPQSQRVHLATNPQHENVIIKTYPDRASAEREFTVLGALREFGINLAPEPLQLVTETPAVIMSWLDGMVLEDPPDVNDTESWQRMMAAMGVSADLPFAKYSQQLPMQGRGYMRPGDLIDDTARSLQKLGENHPFYARLQPVIEKMRDQTAPDWVTPAPVGLCRCDPALHNFLLEGCCHILAMDWERADWGDIAAEIGLWSVHPDYEEVSSSHWVWLRWEFARLKHQPDLVPRATVYARLGQVKWAVELAQTITDEAPAKKIKQRDRYLKRAEKAFA